MKDYHINVFWSEEDDSCVLDIPDQDACSAFGATAVEALEEAFKAKEACLAGARENGDAFPPHGYRSVVLYSRKMGPGEARVPTRASLALASGLPAGSR